MLPFSQAYITTNPDVPKYLGWIPAPHEVDKVVATLPLPFATGDYLPVGDENTEVLLYQIFKQIVGRLEYPGPQAIGDCVSHGWKRAVDYTAIMQIHIQLKGQFGPAMNYANPDVQHAKAALLEEFEEAATEPIYGLSRVEVGGQRGSYSDGSVGAWAAKAVTNYGSISWKALGEAGLGSTYDAKRAKEWGAKGLPDNLEPLAKKHTIKNVSVVKSFVDAAKLIQNGYVIPVCSDQGFTMTRDSQGFCRASGTWNHCMMFSSVRWDKPGLLCHQNWGATSPGGPLYKEQPPNTFWVDDKTCDRMLRQGDSFSPSGFEGYPARDILTWIH